MASSNELFVSSDEVDESILQRTHCVGDRDDRLLVGRLYPGGALGLVAMSSVDALDDHRVKSLDDELDRLHRECVFFIDVTEHLCRYGTSFYTDLVKILNNFFGKRAWTGVFDTVTTWIESTLAEDRLVFFDVMRPWLSADPDPLADEVPEVAARLLWVTFLALTRYRRRSFAAAFSTLKEELIQVFFFREYLA